MKLFPFASRCAPMMSVVAIAFCIVPSVAHAYVGPSAAVGLFSAAVGFIVAIVSALGVILLWPIRALIKKYKGSKAGPVVSGDDDASPAV
jgi:hypothetical protein